MKIAMKSNKSFAADGSSNNQETIKIEQMRKLHPLALQILKETNNNINIDYPIIMNVGRLPRLAELSWPI